MEAKEKNFLSKKRKLIIVFGFGLLVILIVFGFYWNFYKTFQKIPKPQLKTFQDDELGISFQIPESWGEPVLKDSYSFTGVLREISFTNRPQIKLITVTPRYSYPDWFEKRGIAHWGDPQKDCSWVVYSHKGGSKDEHNTNGENVFRYAGRYAYGDCSTSTPYLYIAHKEPLPSKDFEEVIDINDARVFPSKIKLSKNFYYKLLNEIYPALTISIEVAEIQSNSFCIERAVYVYEGERSIERFEKVFTCINYQEKEQIEKAFKDFENTELAEEIAFFVNTLKITPATEARKKYENRFVEKAVFADENLGISFVYPKVLGPPVYDQKTRELKFEPYFTETFKIKISTKQDIINDEKEHEIECEIYCYPLDVDLHRFEVEHESIVKQPVEEIDCPIGGSSWSAYEGQRCEIINIDNQKALVRYYYGWSTEGTVNKKYVMYSGDGKRFDIFIYSDFYAVEWVGGEGKPKDFKEFQDFENKDFTFNIAESIVKSIKLLK
jgi:hypothetical protein